jgi:hypothetical protein
MLAEGIQETARVLFQIVIDYLSIHLHKCVKMLTNLSREALNMR